MDKEQKLDKKLDKFFKSLKDTTEAFTFNNKLFCGLEIQWQKKNKGFGQLVLSCSKKTGKWSADVEGMVEEELTELMHIAAPKMAKLLRSLDKGL